MTNEQLNPKNIIQVGLNEPFNPFKMGTVDPYKNRGTIKSSNFKITIDDKSGTGHASLVAIESDLETSCSEEFKYLSQVKGSYQLEEIPPYNKYDFGVSVEIEPTPNEKPVLICKLTIGDIELHSVDALKDRQEPRDRGTIIFNEWYYPKNPDEIFTLIIQDPTLITSENLSISFTN